MLRCYWNINVIYQTAKPHVTQLKKIVKPIVPFLMASMVLLAGANIRILFGHNFSPDESASFLALVDTIKAEAQLVQENIGSNNMSLASDHTNKALSLVTDDVNKEIAERNQRLSDDLNADLAALRTSAESASGNNTASDTDILVEDINGILDEIVTARIDPDQLNNSTIHVLAAVELLDEVLRNYGNAFAVEYDMTNMSMMTWMAIIVILIVILVTMVKEMLVCIRCLVSIWMAAIVRATICQWMVCRILIID